MIYEIVPGKLWQSGTPTPDIHLPLILGLGIDTIVNLSQVPDARGWPVSLEVWWPFDDGDMPHEGTLKALAGFVRSLLYEGRKVLVHCDAGLNRSSLLTGLVLVLDGYTGEEVIRAIRVARGEYALCNTGFENWLRNHK